MSVANWSLCILAVSSLGAGLSSLAIGNEIAVSPGQSIQAAIDAAATGDTVLVASGAYFEAVTIENKAITLASQSGAAVTILDATGKGASAIRVLGLAASDTVIDGFTVRGGIGSAVPWVTEHAGGGLLIVDASPLIWRCTFVANVGANRGGGAYSYGSAFGLCPSPRFDDCTFIDNAAGEGGAYADLNCSARFSRCRFEHNHAQQGGAVDSSGAGDLRIDRCRFVANDASTAGGAIHATLFGLTRVSVTRSCIVDGSATISGGGIALFAAPPLAAGSGVRVENTLVAHNRAYYGGGISATESGEVGMPLVVIVGATIVDNLALGNFGGGVSTAGGTVAQASILRSIVHGNLPGDLLTFGFVADSCVGTGAVGPGNYSADPAFVDRAQRDYHLSANSPCRDRGSMLAGFGIDIDGDPRISGAAVDTGADEFHAHAYFAIGQGGIEVRAVGEPGAAVLAFLAPTPPLSKSSDIVTAAEFLEAGAPQLQQGAVGPFALGVLDAKGCFCLATRKLAPATPLSIQALLGATLTSAESTATPSLMAPHKSAKMLTPATPGSEATDDSPQSHAPGTALTSAH